MRSIALHEDRTAALIGHLAQRRLAAELLGQDDVDLHRTSLGRVCVRAQNNTEVPCVNMSHSGDWVVVCASFPSQGGIVGIDVQDLSQVTSGSGHLQDPSEISAFLSGLDDILTPQELKLIETAPPHTNKLELFARCWTSKEAAMKAIGVGLMTIPPTTLHTSHLSSFPYPTYPNTASRSKLGSRVELWRVRHIPPPLTVHHSSPFSTADPLRMFTMGVTNMLLDSNHVLAVSNVAVDHPAVHHELHSALSLSSLSSSGSLPSPASVLGQGGCVWTAHDLIASFVRS
eukprot:c3131_g1_i2.p1 GENE.c3131_g1_i2~~c3131_g1_i2.p1  ORF type:complete len:316 (-),score=71.57 c3131_g1_i2:179-1039(-)